MWQILKRNRTFPGGIHPPGRKNFSAEVPIEVLPTPDMVVLPLLQNIGRECKSIVKTGQMVKHGEKIAINDAMISASIHAPISGKVLKPVLTTLPNGSRVSALPIKAEGEQIEGKELWDYIAGGSWPIDLDGKYESDEISKTIHEAGIVGLGGAAFPTHVKITPHQKKDIDTLLVNGCECEPYLTCDYRLMVEVPEMIITGSLLAAMATGAEEIIICIEDNKPNAIKTVKKATLGTKIKVAVLKTKYPQGSERHMIFAALKRTMPLGGLPADIGVVVNNVATMAAVGRAVMKRQALTHRVTCVTGAGICNPKNLLIPLGVSYGKLIEYCGGLTKDAARVISGGPMMGFTFVDFDTPIIKGTSGITVLTHDDLSSKKETPCIRCGRCVEVCPMNLVPAKLAVAARNRDIELAKKYNIMGCINTGCCGYICPANIPLPQLIQTGKALVAAER